MEVLAYTVMEKNLSLFFGANHANCLPFVMQFMDNPAQLLMNHPAQLAMNSRSFTSTTARWEWNYIIIHWRGVVEFGWELWSAELERSHIGANFFWSCILFVLHQHTYIFGDVKGQKISKAINRTKITILRISLYREMFTEHCSG